VTVDVGPCIEDQANQQVVVRDLCAQRRCRGFGFVSFRLVVREYGLLGHTLRSLKAPVLPILQEGGLDSLGEERVCEMQILFP
jgi:hypothetical protein